MTSRGALAGAGEGVIVYLIDAVILGVVGLVLIIVTQKKQRVGDMAAKIVVIQD